MHEVHFHLRTATIHRVFRRRVKVKLQQVVPNAVDGDERRHALRSGLESRPFFRDDAACLVLGSKRVGQLEVDDAVAEGNDGSVRVAHGVCAGDIDRGLLWVDLCEHRNSRDQADGERDGQWQYASHREPPEVTCAPMRGAALCRNSSLTRGYVAHGSPGAHERPHRGPKPSYSA